MSVPEIQAKLRTLASTENAKIAQWFFKTGPGEYGEGDQFIGVRVPDLRRFAKELRGTPINEALQLLQSPIHESRALALMILVHAFTKGDAATKQNIYKEYLRHTDFINNWDLVDTSAPHIVGAYLFDKSRQPLYKLVKSNSLWERRISIIATQHFIRQNDFADTLQIAKQLLHDKHDLIHKAVGWMLREVGERDLATEESFLQPHYKTMPRTMLRYAIEKFSEPKRQAYLKGTI
ncbi:MAG TPA: DNA alkylation repair protein [Blastocatellia bacterium]|nr:DNA alkylation repair protein [Blastocatellia bacterium]